METMIGKFICLKVFKLLLHQNIVCEQYTMLKSYGVMLVHAAIGNNQKHASTEKHFKTFVHAVLAHWDAKI